MRPWNELSTAEQDRVLLASIDLNALGDVVRAVGFSLTAATSLGTVMLLACGGPTETEAAMPSGHPARYAAMLLRCARRLAGTPLGNRLVSALRRAPGYTAHALSRFDASVAVNEGLRFTTVSGSQSVNASTEMLDPECFGGWQHLIAPATIQVGGKTVTAAEAREMISRSKESSAWLDGAVYASRVGRQSQATSGLPPAAGVGVPLRERRKAHFVVALVATAAFAVFVFSSMNNYGGLADGFPLAVVAAVISYPIGWGLTRLWAWYRSAPSA